ncbi:HypC/HybG/HupF family hydrogenase formation chaperone [Rhizobium sp. S153]|uniref:HypC/HybG/HupF family hydrogenase formation chaperone n=1 Tax=Ciceribacter sichuanensis TaxID=2949647 RepID=A0ABT0VCX1_9HYPH|nr:HypC/HybG/HupF family hydrogenase formation chaperone [Ciceribacter sp. S153]MCM2403731.1 HypC/HybG/HupF family hydrogenase formation chaperone [Ciceribacter sp. S153]
MCLAIPVQVKEILPDDMAKVTLDGVTKIVSIALVDDVKPGDYLVLHVGYALAKIDPEEAERTLALLREAAMGDPVLGDAV